MTSEKVMFAGENNSIEAITTDFERLLTKFTNTKSVRYEWFLQIWKEMSMSLFYAGRQNDRECREFTEECLRVASAYIQPPYQFQVRICGLYLLYALYFRHPFEPKVKIRVTFDEWKELLSFLGEVRRQQHFDVDYVFMKLRHDRAFHFVAAKNELYMGIRGATDPATEAQKQKVEVIIEQTSAIASIFQSDAIEELSTIHEEYHRYKCGLTGANVSQPDPSFNIINPSLVHEITKAVASHETWRKNKIGKKSSGRRRRDSSHTNSESEGESEQEQHPPSPSTTQQKTGSSIYSIRQEIKERAFSTTGVAAQSRRHRQAHVIGEVDVETVASPRKRRRMSNSGDHQEQASFEQLRSPRNVEHMDPKETLTFGGIVSPQKSDEPGILSMPNLLGIELPNKQKKKRKSGDATSSGKTPKKKTEKSPKKKKQKSTPDSKRQQNTPDPKKQQSAPGSKKTTDTPIPKKQQSASGSKQPDNPGPKKQQSASGSKQPDNPGPKKQPSASGSKQPTASGSKQPTDTPTPKKQQATPKPSKQKSASNSEQQQNVSGRKRRKSASDQKESNSAEDAAPKSSKRQGRPQKDVLQLADEKKAKKIPKTDDGDKAKKPVGKSKRKRSLQSKS